MDISKQKNTFNFKRKMVWLVMALIIFRVAVVIMTINNIPPTNEIVSGNWFFNGADGDGYFDSAKALLGGKYLRGSEPAGLSLLYMPIIKVTGATSLYDIITLMTIFYGVILNVIATILVYFLAKKFLYKENKAIFIAALFQVYPYIFYYFFRFFGGGSETILNFVSHRFLQINFMHIGSDAWSMILMLSSLFLMFNISDSNKKNDRNALTLGLVSGWAAITRLQNFVILPVYGLILLYYKKYRSLLLYVIGVIPMLSLQSILNFSVSGSMFKSTTYDFLGGISNMPPIFNLKFFLKLIEYPMHYNPWLFLPLILFSLLIFHGIYTLMRKFNYMKIILFFYSITILLFLLFHWASYLNPRYFFPILPAFIIYIFISFEQIYLLLIKKYKIFIK